MQGEWLIAIRGFGLHHEFPDSDADQAAADLVDRLRKTGQIVIEAHFRSSQGGRPIVEDLLETAERRILDPAIVETPPSASAGAATPMGEIPPAEGVAPAGLD